MLRYRDAMIADLPKIVDIYNSTIAGRMVTADTEPVSIESKVKWFNDHDSRNRPLWMVFDGENVVGWVSFQSFYGRPAYRFTAEISIYLDTPMRGKGYGAEILQYAMEKCELLEIKTLLGYIFGHNKPSVRLFEKLGFKAWGTFPRIAELDNVERDLIIFGKRISNE